jgi:hypothetical protein
MGRLVVNAGGSVAAMAAAYCRVRGSGTSPSSMVVSRFGSEPVASDLRKQALSAVRRRSTEQPLLTLSRRFVRSTPIAPMGSRPTLRSCGRVNVCSGLPIARTCQSGIGQSTVVVRPERPSATLLSDGWFYPATPFIQRRGKASSDW